MLWSPTLQSDALIKQKGGVIQSYDYHHSAGVGRRVILLVPAASIIIFQDYPVFVQCDLASLEVGYGCSSHDLDKGV